MKAVLFALFFVLVSSFAWAQEPEEIVLEPSALSPMVMHLDPVLVSRFRAYEGLETDAERIRLLLKGAVEDSFVSVALEDVPPFEFYDAVIYLRSCPPAELVGCAYVIGSRGEAEWVITGTVKRPFDDGEILLDDEEMEQVNGGPLQVEIYILDIKDSRVALAFDAQVTPQTEQFFAKTVVEIVSKLVEGEGQLADLRGDFEDPVVQKQRRQLEASIMASSLSDLERELGGLTQREMGQLEVPKLTQEDLDKFDARDDVPPWELVKMEKSEYLRYKNSGKNLLEWRRIKKGRQGQILLGGALQFGAGMYEQYFDGRWALDKTTLMPVEVDEWQAVRVGPVVGLDFSAGYGILPQFDISVDVGFRVASYYYQFHKEVVDQPVPERDPNRLPNTTFRAGASVTYSPFPTWTVRPTVTGSVSLWMGKPVDHVLDIATAGPIQPLPAPTLFFVQGAPGVEVNVSERIVLFARLKLSFLMAGNRVETLHLLEEGLLATTSEPVGLWAPGLNGEAGMQVRVGPFKKERRSLE